MKNKAYLSTETVAHFVCGECKRWWSIGDAPDRTAWYCPWCGKILTIEKSEE